MMAVECVAIFWVVNASSGEKSCIQFSIPTGSGAGGEGGISALRSAMRVGALMISRSHSRRYWCPEWGYTLERVNAIRSILGFSRVQVPPQFFFFFIL